MYRRFKSRRTTFLFAFFFSLARFVPRGLQDFSTTAGSLRCRWGWAITLVWTPRHPTNVMGQPHWATRSRPVGTMMIIGIVAYQKKRARGDELNLEVEEEGEIKPLSTRTTSQSLRVVKCSFLRICSYFFLHPSLFTSFSLTTRLPISASTSSESGIYYYLFLSRNRFDKHRKFPFPKKEKGFVLVQLNLPVWMVRNAVTSQTSSNVG